MKKLRLFLLLLMVAMLPLAMQAQQSLPYSYGFEDNDLSIDGWTMSNCHSSTGITTSSKMNGTYGFAFHWNTNTTPPQYLISPELTGTTSGVEVGFYYKKGGDYTETFKVGYSTTDATTSSFTWDEEITAPADWTLYNNTFPAGTKYIAIAYTADDMYYLYLDDFTFAAPAACQKPKDLAVSGITDASATFSWTHGGSENAWILEYGTADDYSDALSVTVVNDTFKTVNDLTPQTTYYARLTADCGESGPSGVKEFAPFTTPCEAVSAINEPFDGYEASSYTSTTSGVMPDCWDMIYTGTSTYGYEPHVYNGSYSPTASDNCLIMTAGGSTYGNANYVILPLVNNLSTMQISFATAMSSSSSGTLTLGYMTGNTAATFHKIEDVPSNYYYYDNTRYAPHEYILASYNIPAGARLAFKWAYEYSSSYYCCIDDVVVETAPTCLPPTALQVDTVTPHTVTLHWTPTTSETQWVLEYSTHSDFTDSVAVTVMNDTFKTIDNLAAQTKYYVHVKAVCGGSDGESNWSTPNNFTTECEAVATLTEGFEDYSNGLPACWRKVGQGTVEVQTSTVHEGSKSLKFSGVSGGNIVALPEVVSYTGKTLTFYTRPELSTYSDCGTFKVGYITDLENAGSFHEMETYSYNDAGFSSGYQSYEIELSAVPADARIAFNHNAGAYNYFWFVDDVKIDATPTCRKPTNVTKDVVTARTAEISWEDHNTNEPANGWLLVVNDTILVPANTNPYTLTELTPQTRYTVKVMALCEGQDSSDLSGSSVTFTTPESCPKPTNLSVVDGSVTTTSATFNWRPGSEELMWIVRYGTGNTSVDTLVFDTIITLTNLTPATTYMVKVRAFCDEGDSSTWVTASPPLTTECETVVVTNNVPFSENFNTLTSGIPVCWDNSEGERVASTYYSYYEWTYYSSGATGACVRFDSYNNGSGNTNMLKTPVLDLTQVTGPKKLSFNYKNPVGGDFSVFVSTDAGATYTTSLATGLTGASSWTAKTISLDNLDAYDQVVIVFKGTSNYGSSGAYIDLDDVEVGGTPTCVRPFDVTIPDSTITTTTAIVHWTDTNATSPESYTVEYTDGENTYTATAQDTTVTLPSLTPSTTYTVKVMANCGTNDESMYSEAVSFDTKCEGYVVTEDHPFTEDFTGLTSSTFPPICWSQERTAVGTGTSGIDYPNGAWTINTYTQGTGSTPPMAQLRDSKKGARHNLVTTPLSLSAGNYVLSVSVYRNTDNTSYTDYSAEGINLYVSKTNDLVSEGNNAMDLGFISRNCQAASTINGDIIGAESTTGWYTYEVPFRTMADGIYYVIFEGRNQWGSDTYMDNVKVEVGPDCVPPTALQVDTVTARTATLSWVNTNVEMPAHWTVSYTHDTTTLTTVCYDTVVVLTDLVPETNYTAKVMANCNSASESEWSSTVSFRTTPTCLNPTNLTYSDVTDNSVILDWTTGLDGEEEWILVLNNEEILVYNHPLTIDTLRENTTYTVKVRAICSATDTSYDSNTKTFTTPCSPIPAEGYAENFNTYTPTTALSYTSDNMPDCWDYLLPEATGTAYNRPHVFKNSNYSPTANDTCIIMPAGSNGTVGGVSYVIMPPMTDLNHKQITFATAMSNANGIFSFGYLTNIEDASTFTLIETVPNNLHSSAATRYATHTLELVNIPDGARLAFRWEFTGTTNYVCFDDVAIIDGANCEKPTELTVTDITAHAATFGWSENNVNAPENGWMIHITDGTNEVDTTVTDNPFTFDLLDANVDYTVTVRSLCNLEDTSLWSVPATFSTPCDPLAANGYVENFDSYTASTSVSDADGILPTCWDYIFTGTTASYRPHLYNGSYSPTSNNNCVIMTAGSSAYGAENYAIMPAMDTLEGKWMSFDTKMSSSTQGTLTVGYLSDIQDASTFIVLDTIPRATTKETHQVFVNTVPAGARITFRWSLTTSYNYCGIDNIKLEPIPNCIYPVDVTVPEDSITSTTAYVAWRDRNENEPANKWTILLNGEEVAAPTNPFTLTELTPNTEYTLQVLANCDSLNASEPSQEVTFYTACGVAPAEDYIEDFSGYTASSYTSTSTGILPRCWDYIYTGDSYYSSYRPHIYNSSSYSPTANDNCVIMTAGIEYYYYDYDYEYEYDYGLNNYVVLPELDGLNGKQIVFATAMSSATNGTLTVGYVTSLAASAFTAIETVPNNYYSGSNRYETHEVNVSSVPANARIAFRWTGTTTSYYYCTIDDIHFEDLPTCLKPLDVTVIDSLTTTNSITVQWTDQNEMAPANGWTILLNGTTEVAAPTNPFTIPNLNASTGYTIQVKANCTDEDASDWSRAITASTACGIIVVTDENEFSEDFNTLTSGIPACWNNDEGTTTNNDYKWSYNSDGHTGACVRFESYHNSNGNTNVLKTPVLDLTQMTAVPQLSFKYKYPGYNSTYNTAAFNVFVSTDGGATYTNAVLNEGHVTDWTDATIELDNLASYDQVVIVFKGTSDCGYGDDYIYLDDVVVGAGRIPCAAPDSVTIDSNYVVRWTGDAPGGYNVIVVVGNDTVVRGYSSTHLYTITSGLNDGDHAIVYVQSICAADDLSDWSTGVPFVYGTDTIGVDNYRISANIFPNPTTGNVTVESNAIGADLNVYDMFGKLMIATKVTDVRTELNLSGFAPGVYMVRIANSTAVTTVKVVKK